jgi:2-isopropylmalate synthase
MPRTISFFETTLRDGEQTPGVNLFPNEKVQIAQALADMGFDTLDVGFPVSSKGEFEAVQAVARRVRNTSIMAIARANPRDIDVCWEALKDGENPAIIPFIGVSPIHRDAKLNKSREEIKDMIVEAIRHARQYTTQVDFAFEDAFRTEPEYLVELCQAAVGAGVRFCTIPDTVGYATPWEFGALIKRLKDEVPGVRLSAHCHNDLGLAVANSLAAVMNGAERVDCSFNGLGERAGNAATEEVVMALVTRKDFFDVEVNVDTTKITETSRIIASLTGMKPQWTKPVVGANAFAHGAGIHQDGVIKDRRTYEIMTPESVGLASNRLAVHKLSGRAGFNAAMEQLGFHLTPDQLNDAFNRFKVLTEKKKSIEELDLIAIGEVVCGPNLRPLGVGSRN